MILDWMDEVTAKAKISLMCPESDCKGYMVQYPDGEEDAHRVHECLYIPIRCDECNYGGTIILTMTTPRRQHG